MKKPWVSLVITQRTIRVILGVIILVVILVSLPSIYQFARRSIAGVRTGVTIAGYDVSGMLEAELYDAVNSIIEGELRDAHNASFDWQANVVQPEQVGRIIDIQATVKAALAAQAHMDIEPVSIDVLPSITQAHFTPYYRGKTDKQQVSLMVNVDWGNEYIPGMLETFARYDITTTWFPTGSWVKKFPELAVLIAEAGHELGNHGGWHGMASQMGVGEVRKLILDGENSIVEVTGQKPMVFAPPAGDMNKQTVAVAGELGYKTVLWTIDTVDWQRPAPHVLVDRVIAKLQPGALVLMHPTEPTAQALPLIIEELNKKGYQVVTVSELLNP